MAGISYGNREVDAAVSKSRVWVAAIDRTVLGGYAVDAECLAVVHAYVSNVVNNTGSHAAQDVLASVVKAAQIAGGFSQFGESVPFSVELMFWWRERESSNGMQMEYVNQFRRGGRGLATKRVMRRMWKLVNYPDRLPFYEAGIWDDVEIDTALASGVDPALLRSVLVLV